MKISMNIRYVVGETVYAVKLVVVSLFGFYAAMTLAFFVYLLCGGR